MSYSGSNVRSRTHTHYTPHSTQRSTPHTPHNTQTHHRHTPHTHTHTYTHTTQHNTTQYNTIQQTTHTIHTTKKQSKTILDPSWAILGRLGPPYWVNKCQKVFGKRIISRSITYSTIARLDNGSCANLSRK